MAVEISHGIEVGAMQGKHAARAKRHYIPGHTRHITH